MTETILPISQDKFFTCGHWNDEIASAEAFDRIVQTGSLFRSYREVNGYFIDPPPDALFSTPRIDRILFPTEKLIAAGWIFGAVGVELKKSKIKIGPPLAQCADYLRACFRIGKARIIVRLTYVFLWPCPKTHGPVASLQCQMRLGSACPDVWGHGPVISFYTGEQNLLSISVEGEPTIGIVTGGKRNGSR